MVSIFKKKEMVSILNEIYKEEKNFLKVEDGNEIFPKYEKI